MLISKRLAIEKNSKISKEVAELMEKMSSCSLPEFISLMKAEVEKPWNELRLDLYHYITVLNRLDGILEHHVKKYKLEDEYGDLIFVDEKEENLIVTCLQYSYILLRYCKSKEIYNSSELVSDLFLSTSLEIKMNALKLSYILWERFSPSERAQRSLPKNKEKILFTLTSSFPPKAKASCNEMLSDNRAEDTLKTKQSGSRKSDKINGPKTKSNILGYRNISLIECMKPDFDVPEKWKWLDFEYYNMTPKIIGEQELSDAVKKVIIHKSANKKGRKLHGKLRTKKLHGSESQESLKSTDIELSQEGIHRFKLNPTSVANLPYQQIYELATKLIPKERWPEFVIAVYIAKAYCKNSVRAINLRKKLVTFKCLCLDVSSSCFAYMTLASSVFEEEPFLLSYMSDLINPENTDAVPYEASLAAMRAFVGISVFKPGCSDTLRAWGGNMGRSLMFDILRVILQGAKEDKITMDKAYMNYFFNLIANFMDHKRFAGYLRTAGLMNILLQLLTERTNFRLTRSGPIHLIEMFIDGCPEVLDDFIAQNGFNIVIDVLQYEVDFALTNPGYDGGSPKTSDITFSITVRQVKTIDFLLKLVRNLITRHPGDRMRNLYDSPILQSFMKIMENPSVFGVSLLTETLRIISGILNSEPTAYSILDESGIINTFFERIDSFFLPDGALLSEIPDAIGAIALNQKGHTRIVDEKVIQKMFGIFKSPVLCTQILREDYFLPLGQELDELSRHYPKLQPTIWSCITDILETVPTITKFAQTQLYQSPNGSFYYSQNEQVVEKEPNSSELPTWEVTEEGDMLECTAVVCSILFDSSKSWTSYFDVARSASSLLNFITVKNAPFDYVLSNALYSVGGIMKAVSEKYQAFYLGHLCVQLLKWLDDISEFIYYSDDNTSFFDQFDGKNPEVGGRYLSKLSTINCLLYILSDIYGSPNKIQTKSCSALARMFDMNHGRRLLDKMLLFYRRIALEEVIFHSRTPYKAAENVVSVNQGISRYHVEIGHSNEKELSWNGTSAKFKNLTMLFFHFSRCQSWLRYIFATLCRLSYDDKDPCTGEDQKHAISTLLRYAETSTSLLTKINTENPTIEAGYTLLAFNHIFSTLNMRSSNAEPINSVLVIALLQYNCYSKLKKLVAKFFARLQSYSEADVEKFSKAKYVDINPCCTTIVFLNQALSFYVVTTTKEMIQYMSRDASLYPDIEKDNVPYITELANSILVQTSIAGFALLDELLDKEHSDILSKPKNIPSHLIEKVVIISKNFYIAATLTVKVLVFEGRLYCLSVSAVTPSDGKLSCLEALGMPPEIASDFLTRHGNSLAALKSPLQSFVEDYQSKLSDGEWDALVKKSEHTPFVPQEPTAIPHQFMHLCTLDDLNFIRGAHESRLLLKWYRIVELFPSVSTTVSSMLEYVCSHSSYFFYPDVVSPLVPRVISCLDDSRNDAASNLLGLLKSLVDDDNSIKDHENMHLMIVKVLVNLVAFADINLVWIPNLLAVLLRYLTHSRLPKVPVTDPVKVSCDLPEYLISFSKTWVVSDSSKEKLFGALLRITEIKSAELASEISKVLLILCDSYAKVQQVFSSSLMKAILQYFKQAPLEMDAMQGFTVCLLRYGFEEKDVVSAYLDKELDKELSFNRSHHKPKAVRDLPGLVKQQGVLVLRDPDAFIRSISDRVIIYKFKEPLNFLDISVRSEADNKIIKAESEKTNDESREISDEGLKKKSRIYNTGVMSLLLTELMTMTKADLLSTPSKKERTDNSEDEDSKIKPKVKVYLPDTNKVITNYEEVFENKNLVYTLFLLRAIGECLYSYKQAKMEFIMFSKKSENIDGKPKSTAINILIHRLMNSNPFSVADSVRESRRTVLSEYADMCINALVTSVPTSKDDRDNPKLVDPDMTFIRKFTVDILLKSLKPESFSNVSILARYSKIYNILECTTKLLGDFESLVSSSMRGGESLKYDRYYIAREFLEKEFNNVLVSIISSLDVNFPYSTRISDLIMKCLSSLGWIKTRFDDLFRDEDHSGDNDEEFINDEELDVNEEMPDLLKNSTLGMYDVDEIEDEDDDEDMDEVILDDGDIEIVYSPTGSEGDDEEEDDDDQNMDSLEGDDSDSMGSGVDHPSNYSSPDDDARYINDDVMIDIVDDASTSSSSIGSDDDISVISDLDALDNSARAAVLSEDYDGDVNYSDHESESNSDEDSAILDEWINEHPDEEDQDLSDGRQYPVDDSEFGDGEFDDSDVEVIDENDSTLHGHRTLNTLILRRTDFEIAPPFQALPQRRAFSSFNVVDDMPGGHGLLERTPMVSFRGSLGTGGGTLAEVLRALNFHDKDHFSTKQHIPNLTMKSTVSRWGEVYRLFSAKERNKETCRVIPTILNNITDASKQVSDAERKKEIKLMEKLKKKQEKEEKARKEAAAKAEAERARQEASGEREPVYVTIEGVPVDIAGSDIDPEFLQALPDDMRADVFAQHVRQRREEAATSGEHIREMDPDFVASLPDNIRMDIGADEYQQSLESRILRHLNGGTADVSESELDIDSSGAEPQTERSSGESDDEEIIEVSNVRELPHTTKKAESKSKKHKLFFTPVIDKYGVAAIFKLLFVPQKYDDRKPFFDALHYLCKNRRTRTELITVLLYLLQEGLKGQQYLQSLYNHLCLLAKHVGETNEGALKSPVKGSDNLHNTDAFSGNSFPIDCTTLIVASQTLDAIQCLLERAGYMRLHFLKEQENSALIKKMAKKHKITDSSYRYPINALLLLLKKDLIREDSNLMEILTRSIQMATMPLRTIKERLDYMKGDVSKNTKAPTRAPAILPEIPNSNLKLVVNILVLDECAGKVFQQTMAAIQNMFVLDNARVAFPHELSAKATILSTKICKDLRELISELNSHRNDSDDIDQLARFSSSSSDQTKLLRILTALDYLFQGKDEKSGDTSELRQLYTKSALGPLWGALSDCLKVLGERKDLAQVTTILSPLIESLMVVCKHSKMDKLKVHENIDYEINRSHDFTTEPIESLFFTFTEEHKKILNRMIRENPKLMSGPFSVLIRNPKVLEFDNKRVYFQKKLHEDQRIKSPLSVTIRRDQVFLDSYRALFFKPIEKVAKSNLEIHFKGEEGVDAGGLTREWYQVLSRQIFNPDYALFTPVTSDKTTFHPNRTSWINPEHLSFFKFVGMIIGKAIYDGYMLDCHFTRAVFKRLLGKPVSLKDMESLDPDYYKSLVWMLQNDITDIITETFSVEEDNYGEHKIIDLKENGRNVPVTEKNKQEYVRLIVDYRLITSVKEQLDNFLQGFYQIVPKSLVAIFDERELELLISGLPDIDVDDWKNNTNYVNYSASSPQIQWFWRAVKSFDTEERAKLLQFSTGTSKVPLNGFKELSGVNGVSKFSIHRTYESTDRLPTAHTCFNQIDLPAYESYGKLRAALLLAVREGHEGFGFV